MTKRKNSTINPTVIIMIMFARPSNGAKYKRVMQRSRSRFGKSESFDSVVFDIMFVSEARETLTNHSICAFVDPAGLLRANWV